MSDEIIIENRPSVATIELAGMIVEEHGIDRFARVLEERVPDEHGQLNGKKRIVAGATLYLACQKLGGRYKSELESRRVDVVDQIRQELVYAIDNPRIIDGRQMAFAVKVTDYARDRITKMRQSKQGGDRKSALATVSQRFDKTALGSQKSLKYGPYQSDSSLKNEDSSESCESVNAAEIASELTQIGVLAIKQGRNFRKQFPDLFDSMARGEIATFAEAKRVGREKSQLRRKETEQREIERVRRTAIAGVELHHGENTKVIARWKHQAPRLIFADPPFNNGWKYDSDPTGDKLADGVYLETLARTFTACREILAPDGTVCICAPSRYAGLIDWKMRTLGFDWRTKFYWWNHFPNNMAASYPEAVKEILVYAKSSKSKHIFHPRFVESRRNALGDARGSTLGKVPDNAWPIFMLPGNAAARVNFTDAPPEQPFEVPFRCILAHTEPGDLVLDPYCGNGTTGRAAIVAARKFFGIDRSKRYLDLARVAIEDAAINGPPESVKERMNAILADELVTADMFEREMLEFQRKGKK